MNYQQKLEAVRQACIKANPEIFVEGCESGITPCDCHWHKNYPPNGNKYRPIRLADVLLAMDTKLETPFFETVNAWETFLFIRWDLSKDSLNEQSAETISFLYELLNRI